MTEQGYTYKYPRPAVTTDIVLLSDRGEVLLIQRKNDPYKGCWAFPGGFMEIDETLEDCARRELREETGLDVPNLQQIKAFSAVDRDPRGRTLTVAFGACIAHQQPIAHDDAADARWFGLAALPPLAFDHAHILRTALPLIQPQSPTL